MGNTKQVVCKRCKTTVATENANDNILFVYTLCADCEPDREKAYLFEMQERCDHEWADSGEMEHDGTSDPVRMVGDDIIWRDRELHIQLLKCNICGKKTEEVHDCDCRGED